MSRGLGTFNLPANFEVLIKAPLDARQVVGTKVDLTNPATWNASGAVWLFDGAIVAVSNDGANNGIYFLNDAANYTNPVSWIKVGTGGGTITGGTNGIFPTGDGRLALGGILSGDTSFSGGILKYNTHPFFINDTDIIDKKYADMVAVGVHPKEAVQVATISGITLVTPPSIIDGITLVNMDRVLVKNQSTLTENGIYNYHVSGMTRSSDFDFSPSGETVQGDLIPVITGATNKNTLWVLVEPKYYTGGTQNVKFTLFSSPSFNAGNSITITGSTINVDITTGTLATALGNKLETSVFNTYTGTTAPIIAAALTGATNGLTPIGRNVELGGTLNGNTIINTGANKITIGTAGREIISDPAATIVVIGDSSYANNYIYTTPAITRIDAGTGGTLSLHSNNCAIVDADFRYIAHPTFTCCTQLVDKKYVDDKSTGSTTYSSASPSTVTVGGLPASTVLIGRSLESILEEILVEYLLPAFSSFSIPTIPQTVEVGCSISGSKSFSWAFTNASNVSANTMCVIDVTSPPYVLACNISTTSPQSVTINSKTFTSCGQAQQWKGCAINTNAGVFGSSNYITTAYLPYYWGKCTCPGAPGANRPVPTCAMVLSGTKILAASNGTLSITFNATTGNDYIWFAVPSTVTDKTCWCIPALSVGGVIGGAVSAGGNLFPSVILDSACEIPVTTVCWSGCCYDVYISNKQTTTNANIMTLGY
jgi:hypothetical protein